MNYPKNLKLKKKILDSFVGRPVNIETQEELKRVLNQAICKGIEERELLNGKYIIDVELNKYQDQYNIEIFRDNRRNRIEVELI